jgi:hypothetical protein
MTVLRLTRNCAFRLWTTAGHFYTLLLYVGFWNGVKLTTVALLRYSFYTTAIFANALTLRQI